MHELSIALSIIEVAEEEVRRRGDVQVLAVHLRLGPLSGVIKEALFSAYEMAREGTALEGSRLVVENVPIVAWCPACEAEVSVVAMHQLACSTCGTLTPEIVSGRELEFTALEIKP